MDAQFRPNGPVFAILACGGLWYVIWKSARDPDFRKKTIWAIPLITLFGGCVLAAVLFGHNEAKGLCARGFTPCQNDSIEWRPWLPTAVSLLVVFVVARRLNTPDARKAAEDVLANKVEASSFRYVMASIARIQLVIISFAVVAALFWSGDSKAGASMLTITLILLLAEAFFIPLVLWPILQIQQLGKLHQAAGWAYAVAPMVWVSALLWHDNSTRLLEYAGRHGGDSKYLALLILFGSLSSYAYCGQVLAGKLYDNLEPVRRVTFGRFDGFYEPGGFLAQLRRLKRSAHAISIIMAGVAIGFIPPAFRLPDVFVLLVGVGVVALISYLDAELAARHLD